jgi:replicative DNA helicase
VGDLTSHAAGFAPPQVTTGEMAAALRFAMAGRAGRVPRRSSCLEADLLVPLYLLGAALALPDQSRAWRRARALAVGRRRTNGGLSIAQSTPISSRSIAQSTGQRTAVSQTRICGLRRAAAELLAAPSVPRVAGPAHVELPTAELAADVRELIHSLGFQSEVTAASPGRHVIRFTDALPWRYVVAVRAVPSVPVRCVQVCSADQLYLAGQAMIPTHNSALALDFARSATIKHKLPTVVFSLEMGRNEITMRRLSAEARVPMHGMRTG